MSRKRKKAPVSERVRRVLGLRSSGAATPVDRTPPRGTQRRKAIDDSREQ